MHDEHDLVIYKIDFLTIWSVLWYIKCIISNRTDQIMNFYKIGRFVHFQCGKNYLEIIIVSKEV